MSALAFSDPVGSPKPLFALAPDEVAAWCEAQSVEVQNWVKSSGFTGAAGQTLALPAPDGALLGALAGLGSENERKRGRFLLAAARASLPKDTFALECSLSGEALDEAVLGWLLAGYDFTRYAGKPKDLAGLVAPSAVNAKRLEAIASGEALTRDLINTPASDMGPPDLQAAAEALAAEFGAKVSCIIGDALLEQNFPMIHAVGRAADRAPRLIELNWGETGPHLTLVGKGICFDTGGLNIKPGASMALMKKDMGGSATVLGLARMIMALNVPLRLRVLIPAAENSISDNAFRPQDILTSRKGLTVEINNTDAEGRLVLADALALADEEKTDLIISMATLTGAARVAVGPDIAPFYTDAPHVADALRSAGARVQDPVWQMPFWEPYEKMIEPGIADLDNAPKGGFAGSITAALFLRRFVTAAPAYAHFDIFGWQPSAAPGRPKGGVGQGARAILDALPQILDL